MNERVIPLRPREIAGRVPLLFASSSSYNS
jgi:hypothetical protein